MKEKPNSPLLPSKNPALNSFSIRRDYSMDDIQKLVGEMDGVISEFKAEQRGTNRENMVKTIRGGKTVWITKDEMNQILFKRRQVFKAQSINTKPEPEQPSTELLRRLEICQQLIETIRLVSNDQSLQFVRLKLNLEAVINQSLSQARDVRIIEKALQRKKEEDPLFLEMERVNGSILSALDSNNLMDASIDHSFQERHLEEFLSKQKRIEPYEKKAQENKQSYLEIQLKVYLFQFEIISASSESMSQHLEELLYHDRKGELTQNAIGFHQYLQNLISERLPFIQNLKQCSVQHVSPVTDVYQQADSILKNLFTQLSLFLNVFKEAWISCAKLPDHQAASKIDDTDAPKTRMAFRTRKRK